MNTVIANKGSLCHHFSTGSIDTLNIPTIREDLKEFYDKYYSSNIMSLVITGNHSLDDLEKLAVEKFSDIPDKNVELDFNRQVPSFDENNLGYLYKVQ